MKLTKTKEKITTDQEFPGLLAMSVTHNIASTTADCVYGGPLIPVEVWNQILSFFKWTYDTTKSESQVRLYVNPTIEVPQPDGAPPEKGAWAAWAYPQEARSGMSARELDTPEAITQRQQFPDSEGWLYFGTVHHHCSAGAFQSGTDENNEKNQDGIHITIGNMDKARHDMHCRFYLKGLCFEPDMSFFWDIGEQARNMLPKQLWDNVARYQMCLGSSVEFPAQWRENLIEIKTHSSMVTGTFHTGYSGSSSYNGTGWTSISSMPRWRRLEEMVVELAECAKAQNKDWEGEFLDLMRIATGNPQFLTIIRLMDKFEIADLRDVLRECQMPNSKRKIEDVLSGKAEAVKDDKTAAKTGESGNGVHVPRDWKGIGDDMAAAIKEQEERQKELDDIYGCAD